MGCHPLCCSFAFDNMGSEENDEFCSVGCVVYIRKKECREEGFCSGRECRFLLRYVFSYKAPDHDRLSILRNEIRGRLCLVYR